MTAKEYLQQYRNLDVRINAKLEQVERLRELATKVSPSQSDGGHGGGVSDRVGNIVAKIVDMEVEINVEIDRLIELRKQIILTTAKIEDTTLMTIIEMRYLQGKTFETIAYTCNYSWRHVMRLHKRALVEVEKVIECHTQPVL